MLSGHSIHIPGWCGIQLATNPSVTWLKLVKRSFSGVRVFGSRSWETCNPLIPWYKRTILESVEHNLLGRYYIYIYIYLLPCFLLIKKRCLFFAWWNPKGLCGFHLPFGNCNDAKLPKKKGWLIYLGYLQRHDLCLFHTVLKWYAYPESCVACIISMWLEEIMFEFLASFSLDKPGLADSVFLIIQWFWVKKATLGQVTSDSIR